jgi:predicted RND superfamily exporter protein
MKKKTALSMSIIMIILLFALTNLSFAQNNFKVTGKVTDETGSQYREQLYK